MSPTRWVEEWRDAHPNLKGNVRDYATVNELICLSNMESLSTVFIDEVAELLFGAARRP